MAEDAQNTIYLAVRSFVDRVPELAGALGTTWSAIAPPWHGDEADRLPFFLREFTAKVRAFKPEGAEKAKAVMELRGILHALTAEYAPGDIEP